MDETAAGFIARQARVIIELAGMVSELSAQLARAGLPAERDSRFDELFMEGIFTPGIRREWCGQPGKHMPHLYHADGEALQMGCPGMGAGQPA